MQKNKLVHSIVLAILACFSGAKMLAKSPTLMSDPLFGITYDPQKIQFEKMPALLTGRCPRLRNRYVAAWVYGHFKTTDSEYFLTSGLMESHADAPGGARTVAPDEGGGVAVALRGSGCAVDQSEYFLTQEVNPGKTATPIMVPKAVLVGVLQEAFKRYAIAFGGKQEFLKHVKPKALLPVVREQFEAFEKEPTQ